MEYYNLVFVKHDDDYKSYLFRVPMQIQLKSGEQVFVDTIRGECMGTCISSSFIVDKYTVGQIIAGAGAYKPLKYVIGWAEKQEGYKCIDLLSNGLGGHMNIGAVLSTDKGLKKCVFPNEEMMIELIKTLKEEGNQEIVLANDKRIYKIDGIYIPGKGNKSAIMVLPDVVN